ncbi:hypothetical protein AK812_SmicGene32811 [Symbiodinium microadriaticum]|uniref:Uncharacterized protein n=1 Tax=Symbiodinium microadriaticum TaxID=2951 RepID=A0A1Q9CT57_SYMMI|nr:hypothetical protein AK812_SmicGene32811 [Symbiodinium microadriaticum]
MSRASTKERQDIFIFCGALASRFAGSFGDFFIGFLLNCGMSWRSSLLFVVGIDFTMVLVTLCCLQRTSVESNFALGRDGAADPDASPVWTTNYSIKWRRLIFDAGGWMALLTLAGSGQIYSLLSYLALLLKEHFNLNSGQAAMGASSLMFGIFLGLLSAGLVSLYYGKGVGRKYQVWQGTIGILFASLLCLFPTKSLLLTEICLAFTGIGVGPFCYLPYFAYSSLVPKSQRAFCLGVIDCLAQAVQVIVRAYFGQLRIVQPLRAGTQKALFAACEEHLDGEWRPQGMALVRVEEREDPARSVEWFNATIVAVSPPVVARRGRRFCGAEGHAKVEFHLELPQDVAEKRGHKQEQVRTDKRNGRRGKSPERRGPVAEAEALDAFPHLQRYLMASPYSGMAQDPGAGVKVALGEDGSSSESSLCELVFAKDANAARTGRARLPHTGRQGDSSHLLTILAPEFRQKLGLTSCALGKGEPLGGPAEEGEAEVVDYLQEDAIAAAMKAAYRRGMVAPVDERAKMGDVKEVVAQRFISNLEALPGDQDFLHYVAQLGLLLLEEGQVLLVESEDLTSAFNLFDVWLPYFRYSMKVPGHIFGSSEERVRNLVFAKAGLPEALEVAKIKEAGAIRGFIMYDVMTVGIYVSVVAAALLYTRLQGDGAEDTYF